jgi:hypothetical protein
MVVVVYPTIQPQITDTEIAGETTIYISITTKTQHLTNLRLLGSSPYNEPTFTSRSSSNEPALESTPYIRAYPWLFII